MVENPEYVMSFCKKCPYEETCGFLTRGMICENADIVDGIVSDILVKIRDTHIKMRNELDNQELQISDEYKAVIRNALDEFALRITRAIHREDNEPSNPTYKGEALLNISKDGVQLYCPNIDDDSIIN